MPIILVTGASHGIGRAVAAAFSAEPDTSLALVSRDRILLEETADVCRNSGAESRIFLCDVTDEHAVNRMAEQVIGEIGVPDVLVNNAGMFRPGDVRSTSVNAFREQVEVNLTSAFTVTRAFLEPMVGRGSGHLFYMCSVASVKAYPGGVAYCAAKHGLLGLARVVREETKEHGIRVTAVMPGATFTRSWEDAGLPEERFMPPEDIGRTLVDVYRLSGRSVVEEILIRPQMGDV
jgi:NAD(P)-dependent dehydrogenase (short-subunit alcohol dehydrogenase family)